MLFMIEATYIVTIVFKPRIYLVVCVANHYSHVLERTIHICIFYSKVNRCMFFNRYSPLYMYYTYLLNCIRKIYFKPVIH